MADRAVTHPSQIPPTIAAAILKAQKTLEPMMKSATNELYGSGFVPLEEVATKAFELLASSGVGVMQPMTTMEDGSNGIETILFTASGQAFSRKTKLMLSKNDPQGVLAAMTYFRRGALMSTLGLTAKGEDDDGNKASGIQVPVQEEQIHEIKLLLALMRWTAEDIAKVVFALKTKDAATLAINKYRDLVSERVRDDEARTNATKIEVEGVADPVIDESTPEATIGSRIKALRLASPSYENKLVKSATGKPFLANVKTPEDFKKLDEFLAALENGTYHLPAEFYAPRDEEIIVEEPVA